MSDTTWQPVGYSSGDLTHMQREAEKRVREMQEQVNRRVSSTANHGGTNLPSIPIPLFMQPPKTEAPPKKEKIGLLDSLSSVMDIFGFEQDHLILLMLIFVLLQAEDTDKTLLLALGYLLL